MEVGCRRRGEVGRGRWIWNNDDGDEVHDDTMIPTQLQAS